MNRQRIEKICREAGLSQVHKDKMHGLDILLADGYVSPRNIGKFKKLGVVEDEYPMGLYVTMWWALKPEKDLILAHHLEFDWNHDSQYGREDKQRGRINAAIKDARKSLEQMDLTHGQWRS